MINPLPQGTPTAENVHATLSSILNKGRKWGHAIPEVRRQDIEFLADEKPKAQPFFFDADTAARIINAAPYPFKLMFLIAATCGLRIGEVTALKVSSLDFKRKVIRITAALDYATRKECVPKGANSAAPLPCRPFSSNTSAPGSRSIPGRIQPTICS